MLVVIKPYRGRSIATKLVTDQSKLNRISLTPCYDCNMEVNVNNKLGALALYKQLSFIRAKRLYHYYLNGMGAFRLKLLFPEPLRIL
ncbi:unnamed protein product [Brassica oleracea var. botrytis]|uniref:N-acetyltransferase domain-containing protein n=2 Tax=Brassica TaxID=3705 RepID=A0A3P6ACD6_BRAOL|nr:unnamed protein product [Brassica napus]CDY14486.1 BnaC03g21090D [Brassica napus]VDC89507.1 unnamed protein product [Brassica oleracea]